MRARAATVARTWRAWHPGAAAAGTEVVLDPDESAHLVRVLRLRPGEAVAVFDGAGREWDGTLVASDPQAARVVLGAERGGSVDPAFPVTLVQGLCRSERLEWVLQKATELGVEAIVLATCARSEGRPPSAARLERWRRVVLEACKQSGRRRVPALSGPAPLPGELPDGTRAIVLDPGANAPPIGALLASPRPAAAWLAVGPEAGLTDEEIEALTGSGWTRASLGPRILRTETAGLVAAALLLHAWGDVGS